MSDNPAGPPPPYPGGYSNPNDYNAFPPASGFAPPPQPYAPPKDGGVGSYPTQPYGPAPPGYQPGYQQTHGTTVVVAQPAVTVVQTFRESPVRTRCIHCQAEVITAIHYETGTFAWVICCVLWLVGCGLGCCLIPFCLDGCKDVVHTCPNCQQQMARFSRM